jgi:hypothetical protein
MRSLSIGWHIFEIVLQSKLHCWPVGDQLHAPIDLQVVGITWFSFLIPGVVQC